MSYPFTLRFLAGRLLIDDNIEEKLCVVEDRDTESSPPDKPDNEENEENDENDENPNEIFAGETGRSSTLGMIEFTISANQYTFEPTFKLDRSLQLCWSGRDGIKSVVNQLDKERPLQQNQYRCYYILGLPPPPGIVLALFKRFGKNLLERIDTEIGKNKRIYWCILLGSSRSNKMKSKKEMSNDFADVSTFQESPKMYQILGESISTNCAEICHTF